MRIVALAALAAATWALAGCGPNYSPDTYAPNAVQQASKVERGVVIGVRAIDVSAAGVVGAGAGAAAGGVLGAQTPGGSVGTAFGTIGGGLIGGLVGTSVEHATGDTPAWEYVVRKAGNEMVSVTQKDATPLRLGARVLVIAGPQARIVPDYTVELAAPAAPPPAPAAQDVAPPPAPVAAAPLAPPATAGDAAPTFSP